MRKSLFIIFVLLLSCDDNGSGQCGAFTPCGGAIVGTWSITGYCSNLTSSSSSFCPGMTMSVSHVQMNGTFTFTSSGTYSIATTADGTMDVTFPQSCLAGRTCSQLGTLTNPGSGGVSVSCQSNANGDCACTESVTNAASAEQGTYTTSGNSLSMIKAGGTPSTQGSVQYCVQGDTLMIQATSATASGSTTVVATRQ